MAGSRFPETRKSQIQWARLARPARGLAKTQTQKRLRSPPPRNRDANLVVLGNSIALYNPPIRVAEEFAMLDVISGGRLIAGFPVGTSMDTNFCYGEVPATIREKYYEAHDLILKAWKAKDVFS